MKLSVRKTPFRLSLGQRGEMIAWDYFRKNGYEILEKNYRCTYGEIDGVLKKNHKIIFVEIKTRSQKMFGRPEESVERVKQEKITKLAAWYLKEKNLIQTAASFAVLAIDYPAGEEPALRLIENAFEADSETWQL